MSRNACENRRNGNDFHSGHRKQNSRLLNEVQQCTPQWGVQATERSCDSKMAGLRPDKFAFAKRSEAMKAPVGLSSDRTVLRQQDGGVSLRQVRVFPCLLGDILVQLAALPGVALQKLPIAIGAG